MKHIERVNPQRPEKVIISRCAKLLEADGVIAYPTETFYGLGAHIGSYKAIHRIFEIKGRDYSMPIIILVASEAQLGEYVEYIPEGAKILMKALWPGGITLLFPSSKRVLPILTSNTGKVGIRWSSNIIANAIIDVLGVPITSTSANLSGGEGSDSAEKVFEVFGDKLDMIVDGDKTPGTVGSTIVDVTEEPPLLIREGIVPKREIEKILKDRGELSAL